MAVLPDTVVAEPVPAPIERAHTSPSRSRRPIPRAHLLALAAIVAVGLLRGLFWVVVTPVFNPIDEHAHFAYVESMATSLRPPVVGTDHLSAEALELVKRTRTADWQSAPVAPDPTDARWGLLRDSYEGVQGPAYYALMAVPYKVAHPFGVLSALYAVRLASLLLALAAVPVAYLLARELFPRRRDAWLAAPALLVVLQGFNGNLTSVSNDALVVPLGGVTLLAVAVARRRGLTLANGLVTGVLLGACLSTKAPMVALFPLVAAAALGVAVVRGEGVARLLRWGAAMGASAFVVSLPWLAWNLATYGAVSASEEVDRITGPFQPDHPFTVDGVRRHLTSGVTGYWDYQLAARSLGRYMWVLSLAALALVVVAVAVSAARRRRGEALALTWLASSAFVTMAMMLVVIYGVFGGKSSVVGRHLYASLVAVVVAAAAAAFVVAGRWLGWGLVLVLANLALTFEQPTVPSLVDTFYAEGNIGDLSPVVDQGWGETLVSATAIEVTPPCPAAKVAVGFGGVGTAPATVTVTTPAGRVQAPRTGEQGTPAQYLAVYDLAPPLAVPFTVDVSGVDISASATDRDPNVALAGLPGDPVVRVFCPVDDPKAARFAQEHGPDHPSFVRYGSVLAWPQAWAWIGRVALAGLAVLYVVDRRRRRRGVPAGTLTSNGHPPPWRTA